MSSKLFKGLLSVIIVFTVLLYSDIKALAQEGYKENALIYKITGKDIKEASYVFAILKFIPAEENYFPDYIHRKFEHCDILATETLLDHHTRHEMNKAAHLEHGKSLKDYLGKEDFDRLETIFAERLGVPKLKFELVYKKFKPVMLSTTMTRLALKYPLTYPEPELISKAENRGMLTLGLETVEREVELLETFKIEDQVIALKHSMDNLDKQVEDYKEIVKAYKEGDLHKTLEFTLHPVEYNQDFRQNFIVKRNKEWIPKIVEYMHQAPTFFAIGASHISEENGVLHLLELEGYTVTPIHN